MYIMWPTRAVYEELGKYGDVENQVLCRQRVEELDPSIRYCNHRMGDVIQGSDLLDLSKQDGVGLDLLQSKLQVYYDIIHKKPATNNSMGNHWLRMLLVIGWKLHLLRINK